MNLVTVTITETGDAIALMDGYSDRLLNALGGVPATRRGSHVEPDSLIFRVLFHSLRAFFGDKGRMSDFTRGWPCLWRVNTAPVGGPVLPQRYSNRAEAIDAEVVFLNDWFLRS
jgi:hypothetical protein